MASPLTESLIVFLAVADPFTAVRVMLMTVPTAWAGPCHPSRERRDTDVTDGRLAGWVLAQG